MSVAVFPIDSVTASESDEAWRRKLERDAVEIGRSLPTELRQLHRSVVDRARSVHANALIMTGSTARRRRTAISDLDYHLIGLRIETKDLPRELDLHLLPAEKLESDVLGGDDFIQWSLRFGCIVFDDGSARRALRLIAARRCWPDADRKRAHAAKSLDLARRFVATADEDGALVQVRTALSLAARARLLSAGVFPLSRVELPDQLLALGCPDVAHDLAATISGSLTLAELGAAVAHGEEMVASIQPAVTTATGAASPLRDAGVTRDARAGIRRASRRAAE